MVAVPRSPRLRAAARARFGGLPRTYWVLWTGTLVNRLGTFVEPFLVLYLTSTRGLTIPQAGVVATLYGAGAVAAPVLGGTLADRVGRRATMLAALSSSAVLLALLGLARDPVLLSLVAFVLGLLGDAYRPAAQAAVADLVGFADRRRAAGLIFWAVNLGFSAAAVVGGVLADAGYGLLFALDAGTCLAYALVVARFVPETRPTAAALHRGPGWGAVLADRTLLAQLATVVCGALVMLQLFVVLPLSMRADGHGPASYGLVLAANGVLIVLLHPLVSVRALRHEPALVLGVAWGCMALGGATIALASGLDAYLAGVALATLGEIALAAVGPGLVQELAPAALRGRYAGAYSLCFATGGVLAPFLGTRLLGVHGTSAAPWVMAAGLSLVALALQLALAPALGRRRAVAAAAAAA